MNKIIIFVLFFYFFKLSSIGPHVPDTHNAGVENNIIVGILLFIDSSYEVL